MSEIVMPRLSDTMEEGTILRWLKRDGELVARGEELVEIETDKATMTYESDQAGTLTTIAAEGDTLPVGDPIARIGDEQGAPTVQPDSTAASERIKASPLARRMAGEDGVDLRELAGSGPGGRIVKADVLSAETPGGAPAPAPARAASDGERPEDHGVPEQATPPAAAPTAKGWTTEVELSRTQQTIARRMAESKATIPDFALQMDVDMEECVSLRSELRTLARHRPEETSANDSPTYNDMVVKACALALREHPRANASYRDGRLQLHSRVNVGVAVAADDALVVPTVFDAGEKSLGEIARETRALAERVRAGTISPPELGGATFTVSNLGMFGVRSFSAIINPPQAAIVSVGSVERRPVVRDGEILARHTMSLTLVSDHRVFYGAPAAAFLARVRELLQTPSALTL